MQSALRQNTEADDPARSEPSLEPPARTPVGQAQLFGGFLQQAAITRSAVRRRRWTCGISVGLHGLLLLFPLLYAARNPQAPVPPRVPVTMLRYSPGPPPPPRAAPAAPAAPKPRPHKPEVVRAPVVQPAEIPPPSPVEPEPASGSQDEAGEAGGESGGVKGGIAGTVASPGNDVAPAAPAISAAQVRALLARYLQGILRSRIAASLVYPPEAERIGVEGTVLVRVRVDGTGKLVSAALAGACPHEILCEAALQTVHASAPCRRPRELGANIEVTVPLTYRLE